MDILPGFCEFTVVLKHDDDDRAYNVVLGSTYSEAAGTPTEYCDRMFAVWTGTWMALISTAVTLTKVRGRFGQGVGVDPIVAESTLAPYDGGAGGSVLPQNCALLVRKVTGLGGRKNRGRMYIPSIVQEADVSGVGRIDAADVDIFQGVANTFLLSLAGDGSTPDLTPFILHRDGVSLPTEVVDLQVDPVIATQRRRLRR